MTVKGFKNCCISSAVDGAEDYMLWNESEEIWMLGVSVRKMKALTVKMEAVTLIGKGRETLACFVHYCMKLIIIFFLSRGFILFYFIFWLGGFILDMDKYIFPWQTCFIQGGGVSH